MSYKLALERIRSMPVKGLVMNHYVDGTGCRCALGVAMPEIVDRILERRKEGDTRTINCEDVVKINRAFPLWFSAVLENSGMTLEEAIALQRLNDHLGIWNYQEGEEAAKAIRAVAVEIYLEGKVWEEENGLPSELYKPEEE